MRGPNDIGGLKAGPVDTAPHDMTFWEKQIDALNMLLGAKGIRRTDENRRYIEMLGHDAYNTLSYYERWTASISSGRYPVRGRRIRTEQGEGSDGRRARSG